ncbi:hypothetical protein DPMN_121441 [Dreissena polymorpha]|uniref:Uncharacterized protein n=1 Tax=Dreissena polymorpha TaxID=45954 RepID=A0A9D4GMR4_DREPO|nr:hypothetical protein DPMN_121441 [Dreissena polymorpha]
MNRDWTSIIKAALLLADMKSHTKQDNSSAFHMQFHVPSPGCLQFEIRYSVRVWWSFGILGCDGWMYSVRTNRQTGQKQYYSVRVWWSFYSVRVWWSFVR